MSDANYDDAAYPDDLYDDAALTAEQPQQQSTEGYDPRLVEVARSVREIAQLEARAAATEAMQGPLGQLVQRAREDEYKQTAATVEQALEQLEQRHPGREADLNSDAFADHVRRLGISDSSTAAALTDALDEAFVGFAAVEDRKRAAETRSVAQSEWNKIKSMSAPRFSTR
jgi:hypothetical protein